MNCELSQRRLLEALSPDEPPPEVAAHLADCAACRAWQHQLVRIERHVPLLPTPLSTRKERFLRSLKNEPDLPSLPSRRPVRRRRLLRPVYWGVGGVAAAVALIVLVGPRFLHGPRDDQQVKANQTNGSQKPRRANPGEQAVEPPGDTLVARLMECDLRLAQAGTPRQRVQMLADLADALRDEAKVLARAAAPEALDTVTAMYARVIRDGLVNRAHALPGPERREVLTPIAARLASVEREVAEVAPTAAPTSAERLQRLALVARDGDVKLRALIQGGAP